MKTSVTIPLHFYVPLIKKWPPAAPEFNLLKNAIIHKRQVEILCDPEQAKRILELARQIHPEATSSIEDSIRLKREASGPT